MVSFLDVLNKRWARFFTRLSFKTYLKIKENRYMLSNFSLKSLSRVNKSRKSLEVYVSAMKNWFTCRMTFPFVSARSPDPREVFEYPQHDRETSQTFSLQIQSQTLHSQGTQFSTQIDQIQEKLNKIEKKHEKMIHSERFWK